MNKLKQAWSRLKVQIHHLGKRFKHARGPLHLDECKHCNDRFELWCKNNKDED